MKKEDLRLKALLDYKVMDTNPEEFFDNITKIASKLCDTSIALISLVDDQRQSFKSKVGLNADETPRDISFCQYAIEGDDIYEIEYQR